MKNFVVYRSSAGSGKTYTLVRDYLRLALHDEKKLSFSFKRILAITFTNKAAAEMKSRVIAALNGISGQEARYGPLANDLCKALQAGPEELKERAATVLSAILHNYSDFAIGTIDSFTHRLVKTFAHDLKLPVNFNVELDTKSFYNKVVSLLLSRIGEDEYTGRLLRDYVLQKAENNSHWDPERQIQEFSALLQKEDAENYLQRLKKFDANQLEQFRKQFRDFSKFYEEQLRETGQRALQLIEKNGLGDEDFKYKKSGPQNFFRKCVSLTVTPEETNSTRLTEAMLRDKWGNGNNPGLAAIVPELNRLATELIGFIQLNYRYYSLCQLLTSQMYALMLLKKIEEITLEQKQEERLVFITEFNQRIFNIVQNEPAPFVYERLGERYHHFLLDEFQDTSSLQWQNILPLLDNSLASGWFNLVVGDGKQSIYRWRNANVKQFAMLPQLENTAANTLLQERAALLNDNFDGRALDTNYRSLKEVVDFNNQLFANLAARVLPSDLQPIYNGLQQKCNPQNNSGGFVHLDTGSVDKDTLDDYTFEKIKHVVQSALANGFSYGDICVLTRKNTTGNTIAERLTGNGIPVVSSDSLLLRSHPAINVLLAFLRYISNTADAVSAAVVLKHLKEAGFIDQAEFQDKLPLVAQKGGLYPVLAQCGIPLSPELLALHSIADACVLIIHALRLHTNAYHYLRFFLDEVNDFLLNKNTGIASFLEWWNTRSRKASLVVPDSSDAVKVMTIHASKGLEFPVVIVPYCNWAVYQAGDSWVNIDNDKVQLPVSIVSLSKKAAESGFEKELEAEQGEQALDNLNLLYVAFTRAVEQLHILANHSAGSRQKGVHHWLEEFVKEKSDTAAIYESGSLAIKQSKHSKETDKLFPLQPLTFETPNHLVQIKSTYLRRKLIKPEAVQQGLLVHWLLAGIYQITDVEGMLERGLREGKLKPAEIPLLKTKLLQLVSHPELSGFFSGRANAKLECEILTANGELLRPDRVVFEEAHVSILEYKTGQRNDDLYGQQLRRYERALNDMGYAHVKKLILYVDGPEVVAVN